MAVQLRFRDDLITSIWELRYDSLLQVDCGIGATGSGKVLCTVA